MNNVINLRYQRLLRTPIDQMSVIDVSWFLHQLALKALEES